jgi:energy-coupling factor transporter ATP-binding protein EcfA2
MKNIQTIKRLHLCNGEFAYLINHNININKQFCNGIIKFITLINLSINQEITMNFIPKSYVVAEGEDFGDDILKRRPFGQSLANLIKKTRDPLVIGLNGPWGEGKTTFVKMWQGLLKKQNMPSIYIDAFECDHSNDPFMVVASAISDFVYQYAPKNKQKQFINKAKVVGGYLLTVGAKVGIQVATAGIVKNLEMPILEKPSENFSKELSATAENFIKKRLESHRKELDSIKDFKEFLSTIPQNLSYKTDYPLTIIIDELDRCKPSFAVELLEKIKHLFSAENITFVLVINKAQLEESIKTAYGQNIDARMYLQKFISLEASLSKRTGYRDGDNQAYTKFLMNFYGIDGENGGLHAFLPDVADHLNMSLRDIEKVFLNLKINLITNGSAPKNYALLTTLLCLKVARPDLFNRIIKSQITYFQLFSGIQYEPISTNINPIHNAMHILKHCLMSDREFDDLPSEEKSLYGPGYNMDGDRKNFLMNCINSINNFSIP